MNDDSPLSITIRYSTHFSPNLNSYNDSVMRVIFNTFTCPSRDAMVNRFAHLMNKSD